MESIRLCPLMEEAVDDGFCFVIHMVVKGHTAVDSAQESARKRKACGNLQSMPTP